MKKLLWMVGFSLILLAACGGGADVPTTVEIIHLNHAPILPTVAAVEALLAEYGDRVTWQTYDFDTDEGQAFAEDHGLFDHTPIAVFIDGEMEVEVNGRPVKFYSFPQGEGVGGMVAEGGWSLDDLRAALDQATAE